MVSNGLRYITMRWVIDILWIQIAPSGSVYPLISPDSILSNTSYEFSWFNQNKAKGIRPVQLQ